MPIPGNPQWSGQNVSCKRHAHRPWREAASIADAAQRHVYAATVTWVTQASFKPLLIMTAVRRSCRLFECLSESKLAALNILTEGQVELARKFFVHAPGRNGTFDGEPYNHGITAVPVLEEAAACMECRVSRIVNDVGDHAIVIMEVVAAQCRRRDARPLSTAESPWKYGG
jgi:flavin reductase (DIM6/NTAB) family NADH-FMN oxidoreductase RutF